MNFVIYYVAPISPTTKKKIQSYLTGFFLNGNLTLEAQKHISRNIKNKIIILTLQAAFLRSGLYCVRLLALIFAIFVSRAPETEWKRFSEIVCDKNKSVEFRDCKVRVSVNFFGGENLPRHAAIYGKVDRIGKADEHINEQGDLVGQWVVKKLHNAEILIGFNQKLFQNITSRR